MNYVVKRTTANDKDFQLLVKMLDNELWNELHEDQATYDQFNIVVDILTAVVVYVDGKPVGCGCFKNFNVETVEIKRMFVQKDHRGKGLSKKILLELEQWAKKKAFRFSVLETSIHFTTAINLYTSNGYNIIPNYGQYVHLTESVCMKKQLL